MPRDYYKSDLPQVTGVSTPGSSASTTAAVSIAYIRHDFKENVKIRSSFLRFLYNLCYQRFVTDFVIIWYPKERNVI